MSKELFFLAHEQLVSEYLDEHPDADWSEAYEKTSDKAYDRMLDLASDQIDAAMARLEDERFNPPK